MSAETDPFAPPQVPVRVRCIHCDSEYLSSDMFYGKRFNSHDSLWWCKNKACDGAGYGFDIFPIPTKTYPGVTA